ncbi:hypothetical protein MPC1_3370003 [Methylocella tundrae]|nr:hypothetical protein MPC1_3370003 [Methylocella tundrae]
MITRDASPRGAHQYFATIAEAGPPKR